MENGFMIADVKKIANILILNGANVIYGSYNDVLQLAYSSKGLLHPSAIYYNRFPLASNTKDSVVAAINLIPTDYFGDDALKSIPKNCMNNAKFIQIDNLYKFCIVKIPTKIVSPAYNSKNKPNLLKLYLKKYLN